MAPQLKTCLKTVMLYSATAPSTHASGRNYSSLPTASGHRFWDRLFQQALAALLHAVCAVTGLWMSAVGVVSLSPEPARLRRFVSQELRTAEDQSLKRSTPEHSSERGHPWMTPESARAIRSTSTARGNAL